MLAKRTKTPTVFSGAILLMALSGCSLQDYDKLGEGNKPDDKTDEETEEPEPTTDASMPNTSTVEVTSSETTDLTSGPDASVTEETSSEPGAPSSTAEPTSAPTSTSTIDTVSSTTSETSVPPDPTSVDETSMPGWVPGPIVVDPNNLLTGTNTDFEAGKGDWTPLGGAVIQNSTTNAYTGTKSLQCAGRTQTWEGPSIEAVDILEKGKQYIASGWVRTADAAGQGFHIVRKAICVYDGGVVETKNAEIYLQLASTYALGNTWTQISTEPFSMPDCDLETFVLYFEGPVPGKSFYLDDVSIVEVQ